MHYKLDFNNLKFIFIFVVLLCAVPAWSAESGIGYRILTFPAGNFWEATETRLAPTSGGRVKTVNQSPHFEGSSDDCDDLLQQFQKRPLAKMFENKYISKSMFDSLTHFLKLGIQPQQLILISQHTDMREAEAKKLFGGEIPEDRLAKADLEAAPGTVRILRGTLYLVRGYEPILDARQRMKLRPLPVPWEKGAPLPSKLERLFDRQKVTAMVEVGRAFMEKGPIPGEMNHAAHVAMTYLHSEARVLGISPEKLLLTAHFLDPQHTRLYTRGFPFRLLTPSMQVEIENDFTGTMSNYLSQSLPKGADWAKYNDTVVVGTLAEVLKQFPVTGISEDAVRVERASGGRMKNEAVIDFMRESVPQMRDTLSFTFASRPTSKPLVLRDLGTIFLEAKIYRQFQNLGWNLSLEQAEEFMEALDIDMGDPDIEYSKLVESALHLSLDINKQRPGESLEPNLGISISNLDPSMAQQYPITYVAAVVLSVADMLEQKIEKFSPQTYAVVLNRLNVHRQRKNLKPVRELNLENFLDTFELTIGSTFATVNEQARQIGGRPVKGLTIVFIHDPAGPNQPKGFNFGAEQFESTLYHFDKKTIDELRRHFPHAANNARQMLSSGLHGIKLRMALSGVF